jgi:hypothetical protein
MYGLHPESFFESFSPWHN